MNELFYFIAGGAITLISTVVGVYLGKRLVIVRFQDSPKPRVTDVAKAGQKKVKPPLPSSYKRKDRSGPQS